MPNMRPTDTESSVIMYDEWGGARHPWDTPHILNQIYWSLFYLSFVGIWAYQSLLSAQAYYQLHFPTAGLEFWGTVSLGSAMFLTHCLQVALDVDTRVPQRARVVTAFLGFVLVAVVVMLWRQAAVIIAGFALVGMFTSLSQTPLYGLAGLFSTGAFTQALSAGNGLAGMLTVTVETLIRLAVVRTGLESGTAHLVSFLVFMSLLVVLGLGAVGVYLTLVRMPVIKLVMADSTVKTPGSQTQSGLRIAAELWLPATTEFLALFVSLAVWPGLPCSAKLHGWFAANRTWYCAPAVIAAYNYADLLGRSIAGLPVVASLSLRTCAALSVLRCLFIPGTMALVRSAAPYAEWTVLLVVFAVGLSNGVVATVPMMKGPLQYEGATDRRIAAAVMTAALFGGIAAGSILPAVMHA